MHLFYTPDLNESIYTLDEIESKHCIKVLRLNSGDFIYLIDGTEIGRASCRERV